MKDSWGSEGTKVIEEIEMGFLVLRPAARPAAVFQPMAYLFQDCQIAG